MGSNAQVEAVSERSQTDLGRIKDLRPIKLTLDEFYGISRELERYHAIFYKFWELGKPFFTEAIPTAAVQFDRKGQCVNFLFNPSYWKELTPYQRLFVIGHECLHVILGHGKRILDALDHDRCNICLDVVVNHLLVDGFGFDRKLVDPKKRYCWIDTVFKNGAEPGQNFEYYFNRLIGKTKCLLVDIHALLSGSDDEIIKRLRKVLSKEEFEELERVIKKHMEDQQAGAGAGGGLEFMDTDPVAKKPKWESVIKRWTQKHLQSEMDNFEQWARKDRRMTMLPTGVILPSEIETDELPDNKITVYFFLDTSGSCKSLAPRFWKAAKSVPDNRFDKRLFCFDTRVYEVDIKEGRLYGFGGTSFNVLERHIQQEIKARRTRYPDAVFVITDGYGDRVYPQKPENWYWFLSTNFRSCIPEKSNIFNLSDFE